MREGRPGGMLVAALYDTLLKPFERSIEDHRRTLLKKARGRVLEIGVGTGANFEFYAERTNNLQLPVLALEPAHHMRARAHKRAEEVSLGIELIKGKAEELPFPAESFDTVIGTLVMCTVNRPKAALEECRRVLKPEGNYLFLEHVYAEKSWVQRIQDWVTPLWRSVSGGCHLNRDTVGNIKSAGLEITTLQRLPVGFPLLPLVMGRACNRI